VSRVTKFSNSDAQSKFGKLNEDLFEFKILIKLWLNQEWTDL